MIGTSNLSPYSANFSQLSKQKPKKMPLMLAGSGVFAGSMVTRIDECSRANLVGIARLEENNERLNKIGDDALDAVANGSMSAEKCEQLLNLCVKKSAQNNANAEQALKMRIESATACVSQTIEAGNFCMNAATAAHACQMAEKRHQLDEKKESHAYRLGKRKIDSQEAVDKKRIRSEANVSNQQSKNQLKADKHRHWAKAVGKVAKTIPWKN